MGGMDIGTLAGAITLDDAASAVLMKMSNVLDRFGQTTSASIAKANESMTGSIIKGTLLGNALYDVGMKALAFGKNVVTSSLMAGARLEQLGVATRYLGEQSGYSADYIDDLAKKIQKSGIDGISTRESIVQLLNANIDLSEASKLSALAQNMQSISGRTSSEVFQAMTMAISTGNTEILRHLGFQITMDQVTKKYTETTGKAASAMTQAARTQAVMNAVLADGEKKTGLYAKSMETAGKQASSAERAWEEVSEEIGTVMLPITSTAIKAWYKFGSAVRDAVTDSQSSVKGAMYEISGALQKGIDKAGDWAAAIVEAIPKIVKAYQDLPQIYKSVGAAAAEAAIGVWALTTAMNALAGTAIVKWGVRIVGVLGELSEGLYGLGFIEGLGVSFSALGTAIASLTNPLGWVTIGASALYAVLRYFDKVGAFVSTMKEWGETLVKFVMDPVGGIVIVVQKLIDKLLNLRSVLPGIKPIDYGAIGPVKPPVGTAFHLELRTEVEQKADRDRVTAQAALEAERAKISAEYTAKVNELQKSLLHASEASDIFTDVFNRLNGVGKVGKDVLLEFIPHIEKLAAANGLVTDKMRSQYRAAQEIRMEYLESGAAILEKNDVTLSLIATEKELGMTEAQIAVEHGSNAESLVALVTQLERAAYQTAAFAKLQDDITSARNAGLLTGVELQQASLRQQENAELRALETSYKNGVQTMENAEFVGQQRYLILQKYTALGANLAHEETARVTREHTASLEKLLATAGDYHEKNRTLTLSGTALELDQIRGQHDAAVNALGDINEMTDEQLLVYRAAKGEIDAFYDHEVNIATRTYATIEERMRRSGVLTRAELVTNYNQFRTTYDQMVQDGQYTGAELSKAWKDVADAAVAADIKIGTNWHEMFKTIVDDLKTIPDLLIQAFTGGGGLTGALKGLGTKISASIMGSVYQSLAARFAAGGIGGLLGTGGSAAGMAAAGGSFGAPVGAIGGLGGPGSAAVGGVGASASSTALATTGWGMVAVGGIMLAKWAIGAWQAHKAAMALNDERDKFTDGLLQTATTAQLAAAGITRYSTAAEIGANKYKVEVMQVEAAFVKTGRTAAEGDAALKRLWDAKTPDQYRRAVDEINNALSVTSLMASAMRELSSAEDKYHFTAIAASEELLKNEKLLIAGHHSEHDALYAMRIDFSGLASDAIKYGTVLDESMRDPIQKLIDMGEITLDDGSKLTDINLLTFGDVGDAGKAAMEDIRDAVLTLVAAIKLNLGDALTDAERKLLGIDSHIADTIRNSHIPWVTLPTVPALPGSIPAIPPPPPVILPPYTGEGGEARFSANTQMPTSSSGNGTSGGRSDTTLNATLLTPDGDVLGRFIRKADNRDWVRKHKIRAA